MLRAVVMLYDALLGFALLFGPWTRLWQENWLFWQAGSLQSFLMSGPVRGAVSGFGAAFLIRTAGRLAGIAVVEGDDDPPGPGRPEETRSEPAREEPSGEQPSEPPAREEAAPLVAGETSRTAPAGIRER
jgi:hypothetical protein